MIKKRILSILLAAVLMCSPGSTLTAEAEQTAGQQTAGEEQICVNVAANEAAAREEQPDCTSVSANGQEQSLAKYLQSLDIHTSEQSEWISRGVPQNGLSSSSRAEAQDGIEAETLAALPARYDPRPGGVSQIRQQVLGSCWAYAAIAAVESNLIKKGYADTNIDLSELQLIYFMSHKNVDPLGNYTEDTNNTNLTVYDLLNKGGSSDNALYFFSKWTGPVAEAQAPMNQEMYRTPAGDYDYSSLYTASLDQSLCAGSGSWHFKGAKALDYDLEHLDYVKELIQNYGGVTTSYHSANAYYHFFGATEDRAYYYPWKEATNHAVELVGWDDAYPCENFRTKEDMVPPANGAWLVKNSWGVNSSLTGSGYFWMSYYDRSILGATAVEFDSKSTYANLYAYDGIPGISTASKNGRVHLNVYEAKAYGGQAVERVDGVMLYLGPDTSYQISVGVDPRVIDGKMIFPGGAGSVKTGKSDYSGFYTIDLRDMPVYVRNGQTYGICVETQGESELAYLGVAGSMSQTKGQCYWGETTQSLRDIAVQEVEGYYTNGTPSIRGLTNKAENVVLTTNLSLNMGEMKLKEGKAGTLEAETEPENVTMSGCGFYSTDESVATVDETGRVRARGYGVCDIVATARDGASSDICRITVSCSSFSLANQTMYVGEQQVLRPVYKNDYQGITNDGISWKSSDAEIAEVDAGGRIYAKKAGKVTLTGTLKSNTAVTASCEITVKQRATGIELLQEHYVVFTGQSMQLEAAVLPMDTTNQTLHYESDFGGVTVSDTGLLHAVSAGDAVVTVRTTDGSNLSRDITVHIAESVQYITPLGGSSESTIDSEAEACLKYYVCPLQEDNQGALSCVSSDPTVVEVLKGMEYINEAGANLLCRIKGRKPGRAVLTVKAEDGIGAQCKITVTVRDVQTPNENPTDGGKADAAQSAKEDTQLPSGEQTAKPPTQSVPKKLPKEITAKGLRYRFEGTVLTLVKAPDQKSIKVPSYIRYNGKSYRVTKIGARAFYKKKKLQRVQLPATITEIGGKAFYASAKLKNITIKSTSLKKVGTAAFKKIAKKAYINIPDKKRKAYRKMFAKKTTKDVSLK